MFVDFFIILVDILQFLFINVQEFTLLVCIIMINKHNIVEINNI
jgi:hypothetical protein